MIAILDEIAEAHARGESLIAVNRSKRPWYSWKPFQTERASLEQLERWAADYRTSAFAVITGEISACVVLDFDEEDGIRLLKRLALEPHVETGRGGFHVRLPHPGHRVGTQNSKVTQLLEAKWPGLDIRGDGGYAIEWGSSEFGSYRILRDLSEPVPIEALPEELAVDLGLVPAPSAGGMFDHVLAGTATGSTSPPRRSRKIVKGHRHRHLLEIGSAMRGRGCGELEILQELRRVNLADCEPPKPEEEVGKLAADIVARFPRGGPAGDREREDPAAELRHRLTAALKVGPADLEVVGAEIHGTRGPQAVRSTCATRSAR
jgi:hypothetical protein